MRSLANLKQSKEVNMSGTNNMNTGKNPKAIAPKGKAPAKKKPKVQMMEPDDAQTPKKKPKGK